MEPMIRLPGVAFEVKHPVPLFASLDGGQRGVQLVGADTVRGKGPGHSCVEVADDLPVGEYELDFVGVGELEWPEDESRRLQCRGGHGLLLQIGGAAQADGNG